MEIGVDGLDFGKMLGLIPVVVKSAINGEILMLGFANEEAVKITLETGYAHFYSRTRRRIWMKGETSGNVLRVVDIRTDCDFDSLIYVAVPSGPTCHTGRWSCFHNDLRYEDRWDFLWKLLVDALSKSVVQRRRGVGVEKDYLYVINPITDNIPPANPLLVSLMADDLLDRVNFRELSKVVTLESLGLPLGSVTAYKAGLPLAVARKRDYGLSGPKVSYKSGYESGHYYIYGVNEGESVMIVDDALSTGGAALSVIESLEGMNVQVEAIAVGISKPQYGGEDRVREKGYRLLKVVDLRVWDDGRLEVSRGPRIAELRVPVL